MASLAERERELAEQERELAEARRQQAATAEVLRVISRSPRDLDAVFDALMSSAILLIGAKNGTIFLRQGDGFEVRALGGEVEEREFLRRLAELSKTPGRDTLIGLVLLTEEVVNIGDVAADLDYDPELKSLMSYRAILGVPLRRGDAVIGGFSLTRRERGEFTRSQVELVKTFADQAVVAIENARLFEELQAKTRDLEELLVQQTATADVLKVISRSAFDLQAVFDTLLSSAATLCGAIAGNLWVRDGDVLRHKATFGLNPDFANFLHERLERPSREMMAGRVFLSGKVEAIPDALEDTEYAAPTYGLTEARSVLGVPLLRGESVEGAIVLNKREPGPFSARQIELVKTFADQAVIAIENVRLFDEVQAKTRDLEEALAQQTATADVLRVISRSAFDLDAVLKTLTDSARSLSGAAKAAVFVRDGEAMRICAESGFSPALIEYAQAHPIRAGRETFTGRAALSGEVVHIPDVLADPDYDYGEAPRLGDYRAGIGVPLLRAGRVEGVFALMRPQPGAFTPRQIEMARAFADQAVIAIENVRLFDEVQAKSRDLEESLQQQTATADVLKVISRSAFDLQTVLRTLVELAANLCEADRAIVTREVDGVLYRAESYGFSDEFMAQIRRIPVVPERGTISGRVLLEGKAVQVADVEADPEYTLKDYAKMGEFQTCLGIPMLRNGAPNWGYLLAPHRDPRLQ